MCRNVSIRVIPVCYLAATRARRATYGPFTPLLDEPFRRANNGPSQMRRVPRQFVYGHFVYDTSSTDISSTDISSTTVYQRVGQLYIQLLFQQIIIFINSNFYLHYDSFLLISLPLTL